MTLPPIRDWPPWASLLTAFGAGILTTSILFLLAWKIAVSLT